MPKTHSVSIIIPCRDDYKYLSSILLDLSNLSPLPEIIVSDASKDHGVVKEICVDDGEPVEVDQKILILE